MSVFTPTETDITKAIDVEPGEDVALSDEALDALAGMLVDGVLNEESDK